MISLDGHSLNLNTVASASRYQEKIELSDAAKAAMQRSQENLQAIIAQAKPVYGLNTGFGIFADRTITRAESQQLNRNLILSHAVGTGDPLPVDVVRAAMLIRANSLAKGYSGIKTDMVQVLLEMLNKGVIPVVYDKGSLGSSGDLCMLAQMALVASGAPHEKESESGLALYQGEVMSGRAAMQKAGIERLTLSDKDGLALINGATFSAALLALGVYDSAFLCYLGDMAAALSFEALLARSDPLHPELHQARELAGQIESAAAISAFLEGSTFVNAHHQVQDAYSLRCAPQVHGAVRDTLRFVEATVTREINAATDNPLIVGEGLAISGGNFHGEAVGMNADFLAIALSELSGISERRTFRLMDSHLNNGLPAMLVGNADKAGLNSGTMMLQYTAASLALENQTLASPDSVRSLPTSANQEDFNANAYNAAWHMHQVLENAGKILCIEIYSACRAIDLRSRIMPKLHLGRETARVYEWVRERVPFQDGDAYWKEEIDLLQDAIIHDKNFRETFYNSELTNA
ncbi:MAG: histidine ammonia-lyase [Chloroflexota bacterium]|nr:histidine ammonia-lyase [Chloroflexota bacterium]